MDAVDPTQNTKLSCDCIKKAVDKPISQTASRTRLNIAHATNLTDIGNCMFNEFNPPNKN